MLDHLPTRRTVPGLIFVDLNMPGENGLECLARIKDLFEYRHVPVIIYTTSLLSKDVMKAFDNGASLYLHKTSSDMEMLEMVHHLTSMQQQDLQCPKREHFCYCPKRRVH